MVDLIFWAKRVIVTPVEVHLAEHVVRVQGTPSNPRVWFILHFDQHWK